MSVPIETIGASDTPTINQDAPVYCSECLHGRANGDGRIWCRAFETLMLPGPKFCTAANRGRRGAIVARPRKAVVGLETWAVIHWRMRQGDEKDFPQIAPEGWVRTAWEMLGMSRAFREVGEWVASEMAEDLWGLALERSQLS